MTASLSYNRMRKQTLMEAKILHRLGIAMQRFCLCLISALFLFPYAIVQAQQVSDETVPVMEARDLAVDATADSAVAARSIALAQGQRAALNQIFRRITLREDWPRLPAVTAQELPDLVSALAIAEEKTSDVRYLAKLSVRFKERAIHGLLNEAGISYSDTRAKPALILPVWEKGGVRQLFEDSNAWRQAWETLPLMEDDLLPLRLPLSDLEDISALGADAALLGYWNRFAKLTARYGVDSVIAVHAANLSGGAMQVDIHWHGEDGTTTTVDSYPAQQGETTQQFLGRLAALIAAELGDDWKRRTLLNFEDQNSLSARIPFEDLKSWQLIRRKLREITVVRKVDVLSITRFDAQVVLNYLGDEERLSLSLAQQDLLLYDLDGYWEIRRRDATGSR
jgi:hypothetical protein